MMRRLRWIFTEWPLVLVFSAILIMVVGTVYAIFYSSTVRHDPKTESGIVVDIISDGIVAHRWEGAVSPEVLPYGVLRFRFRDRKISIGGDWIVKERNRDKNHDQ